ncbi:MAG: NAD(P)H-dependent oxidoreductase subunit E [Dehalococcoidia bacterium]|nr:NAD(P)H-dependent oxidoreductase subunit E [Dehalococcoidia bacterium]
MTGVSGIVSRVVEKHGRDKGMLIQILLDLQGSFGWLPREVLSEVRKELGIPLTRVYQVATFYKAFSFAPKGRNRVRVCMGTACQVRGAPLIRDRVQQILGIEPGETSTDMKFSMETVNCLGCCAMGPIMTVGDVYHGHLTISDVEKTLDKCG